MKKEEEIQWTEGTMTKLGKVKIIRQGQVEEKEKVIDRKKLSVKKLQEECNNRKIGFMTTWSKAALIKRLEDEDVRDKEMEELKNQLKEVKEAPKKASEEAQLELAKCEKLKIELEANIASHHQEKVNLGELWVKNNEKIEEIKSRIKSLI